MSILKRLPITKVHTNRPDHTSYWRRRAYALPIVRCPRGRAPSGVRIGFLVSLDGMRHHDEDDRLRRRRGQVGQPAALALRIRDRDEKEDEACACSLRLLLQFDGKPMQFRCSKTIVKCTPSKLHIIKTFKSEFKFLLLV